MNDETPRPRRSSNLRWGIPASVALHLVFAAILFLELPFEMPEPQKEESVSVEIVPPPEEKKPEPAPPPPPKAEKKEEPPPPKEEKKPEPPAAAAERQPAGGRVPIPVLRPVFAFGEQDSGPRKAPDGNAAQEPAAKPEERQQAEPARPAETAEKKEPAAGAKPQPAIDLPKADMADQTAKPGAGDVAAETIAALEEALPESPPKAEPKPDAPAQPDAAKPLPEVKTLFSTAITDNPVAMTAMADMPRGERAAQLCVTELREQLRRASPPYRPELLPSFGLKTGTVLDVRNAAFRASARWYDLRFRCELDEEAMTVRSFAFEVGKEIPRSEWKSRGFPIF